MIVASRESPVREIVLSSTSPSQTLQLRGAVMLLDDPDVGCRSSVIYRLRWSGAWFIFWGGPTELVDYHVVSPNQRHASDVVISKDGATHSGDGKRNDQ
jgi:hypothetical protein